MSKRAHINALAILILLTLSNAGARSAVGSDGGSHKNQDTQIVAEASPESLDEPAWIADRGLLQELLKQHACDKVWATLWPWAKRGNMEARFLLFMLMVPPPDADILFAPGNVGDYATTMRDALVMAVHSLEFEDGSSESKHYRDVKVNLFRSFGGEESPRAASFMACLNKDSSGCVEFAVKEKLVPSFDEYAAQIDALMENGMTGSCSVVK